MTADQTRVTADHDRVRRYLAIIRRWQDVPRAPVEDPVSWLERQGGAEVHPIAFWPDDLKGGNR